MFCSLRLLHMRPSRRALGQYKMPTVFSGKLDGSEAVRYFHVSLVIYYLRQASNHALEAQERSGDDEFKESLLAILFSSLSVESFSNEMAENALSDSDLDTYQKKERRMSVVQRIQYMFSEGVGTTIDDSQPPLSEIAAVVALRNKLVHYKPADTAGKMYLPPLERMPTSDGKYMTVVDFTQEPRRVEPPLVQRINKTEAARAYNAAMKLLKLWNECAGADPDNLANFFEIKEA